MPLPEILAPAGNPEKLATALLYGADAVYLGGRSFNLRAGCDGFDKNELTEAVALANRHGARIYYCLNSMPMQQDMAGLPPVIEEAASAGVHGLIVADPGIFRLARKYAPKVPIHLSTQMNSTNAEALAFWREAGATRVNLARELSCRDIHAIRKALPEMEMEIFIHGAMCLAVSGQCLLSAWLNKRPANLGQCTHPCRFEYRATGLAAHGNDLFAHPYADQADPELFVEERVRSEARSRTGETGAQEPAEPLWRIRRGNLEESGGEAYSSFWAPEDLCLMPYLRWLMQSGVRALKIEGRMKGAAYVAHCVDAYKSALLACAAHPAGFDWRAFMPDLFHTATRQLVSGFFVPGRRRSLGAEFGFTPPKPCAHEKNSGSLPMINNKPLFPELVAGRVLAPLAADNTAWEVDIRSQWRTERPLVFMLPGASRPKLAPEEYSLETASGERLGMAHPGTRAVLRVDGAALTRAMAASPPVRGHQPPPDTGPCGVPCGAFLRTPLEQ